MINEATMSKLHDMRLNVMAETFREQLSGYAYEELSFEDRFGLIVDSEWNRRKNNRLAKLIQNAGFSDSSACIENIEYHPDRKLEKALILRLAACNYVHEKHNVMILGASGAGKSYIACAFGNAACRNFLKVRYIRLPELLNDLAVARGLGTFKKTISQYKKIDLLILRVEGPARNHRSQAQKSVYNPRFAILAAGLAQQNWRGHSC
jgi:DNA replication protein DnaC